MLSPEDCARTRQAGGEGGKGEAAKVGRTHIIRGLACCMKIVQFCLKSKAEPLKGFKRGREDMLGIVS